MQDNNIVTIDGPSGVGKTTVARLVADRLSLPVVNSGRLFRAAAWALLRKGIGLQDEGEVDRFIAGLDVGMTLSGAVIVDGEDITNLVEGPELGMQASVIAKYAGVRQRILIAQRQLGEKHGCVIEGRSTGNEVFPHASLKIWLTASLEARRRWVTELHSAEAAQTILARDEEDAHRTLAPMRKPGGAREIDATCMTLDEVVTTIVSLYNECRTSAR